jgi:hypothetical protein
MVKSAYFKSSSKLYGEFARNYEKLLELSTAKLLEFARRTMKVYWSSKITRIIYCQVMKI